MAPNRNPSQQFSGIPSHTQQRMILGRLVPNAPALWYGASPPAECADERESPEDEVALVTEKEEPERSGSGEESNGAAGGTKTDKGKAEGDSIASAHQEEEEPQQVSQVDSGPKLRDLQKWLELLGAGRTGQPLEHHNAAAFGAAATAGDMKKQYFWKSTLNKWLDDVREGCKAGLKTGPRLRYILNNLVGTLNLGLENLTPRQFKQLFRRALSFRCVRRAIRACFDAREDRAWFWHAAASLLRQLTRDPALLQKHLEFLRGILDRFYFVGEMLRTNDRPLRRMLLLLTRSLIDLVPMNGSPWLDPLLDDIVRQIMAQVKADVSDPIGGFASHSDGVARACALLMYCVRFHGIRLRPLVFRYGAPEAVARLAGHVEPHVAIAAVGFLQACLMTRDPHYVVRLMQGDLLAPAIGNFRAAAHARTGTGVTNAVHQLLEFVIKEDAPVAAVVRHLLERFDKAHYFPGPHASMYERMFARYCKPEL